MDKKLPEIGDVFGDQVVIGIVPAGIYPAAHSMAGRKMPPRVTVRCKCSNVRDVKVKSLRKGVTCCISCAQIARNTEGVARRVEQKAALNDSIIRAKEFVRLMGMERARARV